MDSREQVGAKITALNDTVWALSALGVALERGLLAALPGTTAELASRTGLDEALAARTLDVVAALDLVRRTDDGWTATPGLAAASLELLRADLRTTLGVTHRLVTRARDGGPLAGWSDDDPVVVDAQGTLSAAMTIQFARGFLPRLPGVTERLAQPGAAVLDVGAGAAGFCITMAREFPNIRVVGLEPGPSALEAGRRNVAGAGLTDRIDLRPLAMEALADVDAYDCAYVAQMFMSSEALTRGLPAVHRSLRGGGWLLTGAVARPGDGLDVAVGRLRNVVWGGEARTGEEVVAHLQAAGFADVRALPGPPNSQMVPIVARRL